MFYAKVSQLLQSKTGINLFDFEVDSIKEPCWDNIIIIIVNLYWGCQHHRKSGLQKGPLKVTTNQYNYVKM